MFRFKLINKMFYISGIYYGITICIVSFATGMTVLTLNIHHKGHRGSEVPIIFKKIFFGIFAKIFCMKLDFSDTHSKGKIVSAYISIA